MKKLFLLSFLVSLLFVSQSYSQWWVQGGNLLWPYGDVTIQNDLNVEGNINGVKKYVALLSQTGTNAPVATVLENTIGDIVWSRQELGVYFGTLANAFPSTKSICQASLISLSGDGDATVIKRSYFGSASVVFIESTDDNLDGGVYDLDGVCYIEIRVYP